MFFMINESDNQESISSMYEKKIIFIQILNGYFMKN